jgi:taurine dioxygenase
MTADTLSVRSLTPALGAEVDSVDLSQELTEDAAHAIRDALSRFSVLFFHDQDLSPERHLQLARLLGTVESTPHPKFDQVDGVPEVSIVINDDQRPPDINVWHTDLTFRESPVRACLLYCLESPATGGDTLWSSLRAAYDHLSPGMRRYLQPLTARHRLPLQGIDPELLARAAAQPNAATHPVICELPENGARYLFVNPVYTERILDVPDYESRRILDLLFGLAQLPEHQLRFRWSAGCLAIWDNRCTQHYAAADYFPQRRVMHRVTVRGEPPQRATKDF